MINTDINAWYDAIAKKAGIGREEAKEVLDRHSIKPIIRPAVPQRVRILSLLFKGKKAGILDDEIDFEWKGLGPGLHAIVSDSNFRGKTTLLRFMQLGLVGRSSLAKDMERWFDMMTLRFSVDDDVFETRIEDFHAQSGSLIQLKNSREFVVSTFQDTTSFESVMETFFFDKLGLNSTRIVVNQRGKDVAQDHGWLWLSSVLAIDPNPANIFGDSPAGVGGMETYLMRMFIGLPWVGTHTTIKAVIKGIGIEGERVGQAATRSQNAARQRLTELEAEREKVGKRLAGPDRVEAVVSRERTAIHRLAAVSAEIHALTRRQAELTSDLSAAEEAVTYAVRERHGFDEARQAGAVFRLLRPEYCPSCDEVFTDDLREARQQHHDCIVCGRHEPEAEDDLTGVREALVEREDEAKSQLGKLRGTQKKLEADLKTRNLEREGLETELRNLQKEIAASETPTEAWKEALKLDAQIEEVRRLTGGDAPAPNDDLKVLNAADAVTTSFFVDEQKAILADVATEATKFARSFGMIMLESIEFQGTRMKLRKAGGQQFFGDCQPGERKRLKIATVLAMLRVSEARGVGRHPGVLFIDSPRTDETVDDNVSEIVKGLAALSDEMPYVQVFVTSLAVPAVLEHVSGDKVRKSRDDEWMW